MESKKLTKEMNEVLLKVTESDKNNQSEKKELQRTVKQLKLELKNLEESGSSKSQEINEVQRLKDSYEAIKKFYSDKCYVLQNELKESERERRILLARVGTSALN